MSTVVKKTIPTLIAVAIGVMAFIYLFVFNGIHFFNKDDYLPEVEEFQIFEMVEGQTLSVPFEAENNFVQTLHVLLINLNPGESGNLHISIIDEDSRSIFESDTPLSDIPAGEFYGIDVYERVKKGNTYNIVLSQNGANMAPYLLYTDESRLADGASQLVVVRYSNEASNWEKCGIITVIILGLFFVLLLLWGVDLTKYLSYTFSKIFLALMLIVQFVMMMPSFVYHPENVNLDPSWRYVLNIIAHKGYTVGDDVLFSYGPLGYICYLMNLPNNGITYYVGLVILIAVVLINAFLFVRLFRLVTQGKISVYSAVFAFLVYIFAYTKPEWDNYMLYTLVLGVVIAFYERDGDNRMPVHIVTICAVNFLFVVMSLSKFSTFTSALAFTILFFIFDFLFNRRFEGILYFAPALVISVLGYLAYNPSISGLFGYLGSIFKISDGWMLSSQFDEVFDTAEWVHIIIIMALFVIMLVLAIVNNYQSSHIIISLSASMFLLYKYASTRHGLVCGLWLYAMLFSAAVLSFDFRKLPLDGKNGKNEVSLNIIRAVAALLMIVTAVTQINAIHNTRGKISDELKQKLHTVTHLGESSLDEEFMENWKLPEDVINQIASDSVGIYSHHQGLAGSNPTLNLMIYPSVQGDFTKVPVVDKRNGYFFNSDNSPTYMIVYPEAIDDRIAFLDEPYTWDGIKSNYQVATVYDDFVLLKKVKTGTPKEDYSAGYTFLRTETFNKNDRIVVPEDARYAKVKIDFNFTGKLKKFFYHVFINYLTVYYSDGRSLSGRAIIPNLAEGFETTYYPQTKEELAEFLGYVGQDALQDGPEMVALSLSGLGLEDIKDEIIVEWYG